MAYDVLCFTYVAGAIDQSSNRLQSQVHSCFRHSHPSRRAQGMGSETGGRAFCSD